MATAGTGNSVFLIRALEKILSDKETKRSQHQQLKKACEEALKDIKEEVKKRKASKKSSNSDILPDAVTDNNSDADKYFIPFELACKSNVPRIINTSLDCIQKLVAYGHLKGDSVDPDNAEKRIIDRIIDTVCGCFVGVATDEGIQLQIIKALLTILTSRNVEVHGGTILQSIRCCYNIYLASRSSINQTTAKASLTQIISTLYQLMENERSLQAAARDRMASSFPTPPPSHIEVIATKKASPYLGKARQIKTDAWEEWRIQRRAQLDPELLATASKLVEQVLAKVVADECLRISVDEDISAVNIDLPSSAASTIDDNESITSSEMIDPSPHPTLPNQMSAGLKGGRPLQFNHILQKDCYLVFRTLCKLSMKPVTISHDSKSHELRSKILSLDLLLSILENSGPVFRTDEVFIGAIKHHLCVALSKNGVSSVPEVFFKEIFLNILETPTSSFKHKWIVLNSLARVCGDSQSVIDIFLNYDCDLSLSNIYARLVNDLSRIGQGRQAVELGATPQEQKLIRAKGLECLVSILKCLVEWSRDLYVNPSTTGLNSIAPITGGAIDPSIIGMDQSEGKQFQTTRRGVSVTTRGTDGTDGNEMGGVLATDSPEQFEGLKLKKGLMEEGLKLFGKKPKKGIKFLQDKELLGNTAQDVAKLFFEDERLDRTAVGDYMGEGDEYCKFVMYAFIDLFDFNEMKFLTALRLLLSRFRLPGESQKIDRIMEKFAGRYVETNTNLGIFASADAAYVLAYSIIMLTTDLHSSKVKNKMTKEDYIRMNRGINDSKDLPREYLESIYDEVASSEIKLKTSLTEGSGHRHSMVGVSEKQRREAYNKVMDQLSETAQAIMEDISDKPSRFTSATHVEHVRPMFKVAWTSVLAALSVALRDSDDPDIVLSCLDGFRCAIRVACIFDLELERDAFIKTLARFTLLLTSTGITEMKAKNIEVIKTLCTVAYTDGNYLQSCWVDVLQCISQLELAQLIGTGVKTRYLTSGSQSTPKENRSNSGSGNNMKGPSSIDSILSGSDAKKMATIQEHVEGTSNQSVVVAVDRIFTGSTRLDGKAIVDFVEALCAVSNQELSSPAHPRMLSLQKIIEISYYNMGRIRLEMSRIWSVIGVHFNTVGCLPNDEVSLFVVDSLRQLSMKFVEKGELANFRFQKDFLRPFEHIMKRSESITIRDMVVRCVTQIIQMKASNIVSGWKNIFSVFLLAAADQDQAIVELSFQTTANIFDNHFDATIASFQDAVKCLSEFACNASYPDTSMEAIRIIRTCAKLIAEKPELFHTVTMEDGGVFDSDKLWMKAWFPIMFELSSIISRCKLDVRTRGLTVMFEIMKTYGHQYKQEWWQDLFSVVFRLFGDMKLPDSPNEKSEWMTTTCNHALYALMDVFGQFYDILCPVLLDDILTQLLWCVRQDNEQLARSGTNCLENLAISVGEQFTPSVWDRVCQCFYDIYVATVPDELLTWRPKNDGTPSISNMSLASSYSSLHSEAIHQSTIPNANTPDHNTADTPVGTVTNDIQSKDVPPSENATEIVSEPLTQSLTAQDNTVIDSQPPNITVSDEPNKDIPSSPRVTEPDMNNAVIVTVDDINKHSSSITETSLPNDFVDASTDVINKMSHRKKTPSVSSSTKGDDRKKKGEVKKKVKDGKLSRRSTKKRKELKGTPSVADDDRSEISVGHPDTDMTLARARTQQSKVYSPEHSLFNFLIIKCVVQLELIQAIDNIIFYPTITRQDDQNILHASGVMSVNYPLPSPPYTDRGMVSHLSTSQLFILIDCLYQSHMFARSFNANQEQRVILMKAGFRGRSKPNLLRQEISSVLTMLRMLYYMLQDSSREDDYDRIEETLLSLVVSMLNYFLSLSAETHRVSWTPVLLLLFTRMIQINTEEFKRHMAISYPQLCELISQEIKYEIRCLLRRVFNRVGSDFCVCPNTVSV